MEREHEAAPRELKRALILAAAIIFAAFAAFAAALAETGALHPARGGLYGGGDGEPSVRAAGGGGALRFGGAAAGTRLLCWLGPDGAEADTEAALYEDASFTALLARPSPRRWSHGSSGTKTASPCRTSP